MQGYSAVLKDHVNTTSVKQSHLLLNADASHNKDAIADLEHVYGAQGNYIHSYHLPGTGESIHRIGYHCSSGIIILEYPAWLASKAYLSHNYPTHSTW